MSKHSILLLLLLTILAACNLKEKKNSRPANDRSSSHGDTIPFKAARIEEKAETNPYDSLAKAFVDTTTLEGKRQWLMNQFLSENRPSLPDFDTLFDLNYDCFEDFIIGHYGQSGTGIKNRVNVYFYDSKKNCYILNEQLSDLANPSFYINQKKITGFYLGNGGGGGIRLEWLHGKWTTTKAFDVDYEGDTTKWRISYPLKHKKEVIIRPYQMIPPEDILETKIKVD